MGRLAIYEDWEVTGVEEKAGMVRPVLKKITRFRL
jgi:hypothetical protein